MQNDEWQTPPPTSPDETDDLANGSLEDNGGPSPEQDREATGSGEGAVTNEENNVPEDTVPSKDADPDADTDEPAGGDHASM